MDLNRRQFLKVGIGVGASVLLPSNPLLAQGSPLLKRKIPSTGESLPIIGIGTARRYASAPTEAEPVENPTSAHPAASFFLSALG